MKVVILAGGLGTRISEETQSKPKPMVKIGSKPILWHIMKVFSFYDINDFIICCGYNGYVIKEYFSNYFLHMSDVTFDMSENLMRVHNKKSEPWKVTLVDTGENSMTGGRLKRIREYLEKDEDFLFTYGDGLADVNVKKLVEFHKRHKKSATVTAVQPPGRFGNLLLNEDRVVGFQEKPPGDQSWINGGYFVLNYSVIDLIKSDDVAWESEPLFELVKRDQLRSYKHDGFWQPMDTLRDKNLLEELWKSKKPPWKLW